MSDITEYHAYVVRKDGAIIKRVTLFCGDDETARQQAAQLVDGHDVELWRATVKIASIRAEG